MTLFASLLVESVRRRFASLAIAFAVVALCVAAFFPRVYSGRSTSVLLALVLVALSAAIALHVRFLLLARRTHSETARVLDATEREFQSIFDSTLDAIVILDDQEFCREANPAALALFGTERQEFVGHPIQQFRLDAGGSGNARPPFLHRDSGHGEIELVRANGQTLFVEYTVKMDYLPNRHVAVLRDSPPGARPRRPCGKATNATGKWLRTSKKYSG